LQGLHTFVIFLSFNILIVNCLKFSFDQLLSDLIILNFCLC